MRTFDTRCEMVAALVPTGGVVAEIGVFEGEFSEYMWRTLKPSRMYLVDTWDGDIASGDVDGNDVRTVTGEEAMQRAVQRFQGVDTVLHVKQKSTDFLRKIQQSSLDLVYVDADHSHEGVLADLQAAWSRLTPGGWLMGHDYETNPAKCRTTYAFGVKSAVEAFLAEHADARLEALAQDGCVSFAIRKLTDIVTFGDVVDEPVPSVAVVSLSDRAEVRGRSWPVLHAYCQRHGYLFVTSEVSLCEERHPSWSKLLLMKEIMWRFPVLKTVVWVDDDVIVTRPETPLTEMLQDFLADPVALMAVQQDYYGQVFNMGVCAVKNVAATWHLLDGIWQSAAEDTHKGHLWEQTALQRMWRVNDNLRAMVWILRPRTIQSFYRATDHEAYRWAPGDFAAHVLGTVDDRHRIALMDQVLSTLPTAPQN